MQSLRTELQAVSVALNSLAENVEVLVKALDSSDDKKKTADKQVIEKQSAQAAQIEPKQTKSAPSKKTPSKKAPTQKSSAKRKAVSRSKRPKTDTDRVVTIIKRAKRGVNIAELRRKTQFDNKKISNIVHRASKANRIKKIDRGIYSIV
jgi:tRNA1(Val) A37 N6-methylase TrmN6